MGKTGLLLSMLRKPFCIGSFGVDHDKGMYRSALYKNVIVTVTLAQNFIVLLGAGYGHILEGEFHSFGKIRLVPNVAVYVSVEGG